MADLVVETTIRRAYEAYAALDLAVIDGLLAPDVVFHVPGHHPLSGTYEGKEEVVGYLTRVVQIGGGRGGFDVHAVTTDDSHGVALVVGTIYRGDDPFVRPIVHVWHVSEAGQLTEYWEAPLDQHAEDAFWNEAAD